VKVSHNTVGAVRSELEGRGQIDHVATRTDTKGRKQAARKKRRDIDDYLAEKKARMEAAHKPVATNAPAAKDSVTAAADRAEARALATLQRPEITPPGQTPPAHIDLLQWDRQVRDSTFQLMHQIERGHWSLLNEHLRDLISDIERWIDEPSELPPLRRHS
jgi:hypothetical protein